MSSPWPPLWPSPKPRRPRPAPPLSSAMPTIPSPPCAIPSTMPRPWQNRSKRRASMSSCQTDAGHEELDKAVQKLGSELKSKGGVGLFYFSGHGAQIAGENYLLPAGNEIADFDDVKTRSLTGSEIVDAMSAAQERSQHHHPRCLPQQSDRPGRLEGTVTDRFKLEPVRLLRHIARRRGARWRGQ